MAVLSVATRREIARICAAGVTATEIRRRYGISRKTVYRIVQLHGALTPEQARASAKLRMAVGGRTTQARRRAKLESAGG